MKTGKLLLIIFLQMISFAVMGQTATASIGDHTTVPGSIITVPVFVNGFNSVGAIDMQIATVPGVVNYLSFDDPNNVGGFMIYATLVGADYRIAISWIDPDFGTLVGVDFPDGVFLNLNLEYLDGFSELTFMDGYCDVSLMPDQALLDVSYSNGSIGPEPWIWTGTESDDWHNKYNWNKNMEPQAGSVVLIDRSHAYYLNFPLISGSAVVSHIQIEGDINLNIGSTGRLTADVINNNSTHSSGGILISSDAESTGSILNYTEDVTGSIECFFDGPEWNWKQVSSPVAEQFISPAFDQCAVFTHYEPVNNWVSYQNQTVWPAWSHANNASMFFNPAWGYMMACNDGQKRVFTGLMNQGLIEFTLSKAAHTDDNPGFNLIGNPYPSAIDWKAVSGWGGRNNLQEDMGGYSIWVWNHEYGNYGVYNTAFESEHGTFGASRYIEPMQGFFVKAAGNGGLLSMNDNVRLHMPQGSKSSHIHNSFAGLEVINNANKYKDEVFIQPGQLFHQGVIEKIFSHIQQAPGLYFIDNEEAYCAYFIDNTSDQPLKLGFRSGSDAIYSISAKGKHDAIEMILEDTHFSIKHNLTRDGSYSFNANIGNAPERFYLHLKQSTGINQPDVQFPGLFMRQGFLCFNNPGKEESEIRVFDTGGRIIASYKAKDIGFSEWKFMMPPGLYFYQVVSKNKIYTGKIIAQ
jgi:hypothetical protein